MLWYSHGSLKLSQTEGQPMQEQLAVIIDAVFSEFEDSPAADTPIQSGNDDSDWYDVPVDDIAIEEEIPALREMPEQLPLESFWCVDRNKGSLLSENATIHGNIQFHNTEVEIHAVVNGDIDMPGDSILLIGKHAMISGEIRCNQVSIAGVVIGNIHADLVHIQETGSIQGNVVYTKAIEVASGAEICGRIQKEDKNSTRNG